MTDHPSDRAIAQAFVIESECRELYDERASKFILHVLGRARTLDAAPADPVVSAECWREALLEWGHTPTEIDGIEHDAIDIATTAEEQSRGR